MSAARRSWLPVALLLAQCQAPQPVEDQPPNLSVAERAALAALRYDEGAPPPDPSNRFADNAAAQALGRRLFFDTSLSGNLLETDNTGSTGTLGKAGEPGKVSCAGCHLPASAFVDTRSPNRQISLAAGWTARRTPTLLDAAFRGLYNWDGRRDSIWAQAIGVMESDHEFNSGRLFVAEQIFRRYGAQYQALFGPLPALDDAARFPPLLPGEAGCQLRSAPNGSEEIGDCRGKPGDGADYDGMADADRLLATEVTVNVAKAIAAYVRQLRCGASRLDAWLDGDDSALNHSEQRGAALFVGRAGCVTCHGGPQLSDDKFHNVGLSPAVVAVAFVDDGDRGAAAGISELAADPLNSLGAFSDGERAVIPELSGQLEGAFRTPPLRCLGRQPSFMHTGQIRTLAQVVAFFNRGGDRPGGYPGQSELAPLGLDDREQADLTAFLLALDGPGPAAELLGAP
jgi:cytochrome c peroxidase